MKTTLTSLMFAALLTGPILAGPPPEFPKIGREYRITLPTLKNGSVRLNNVSTNVVFIRWIAGSWYEVACHGDGPDGTYRANMNIAQVFTMVEAERKSVTEKLKAGEERRKPDGEKPEPDGERPKSDCEKP